MADNENKLLSSNEKSSRIITEEMLLEVLKKDKGSEAIFEFFTVEDFTSKGDNYCCFVTSIKVHYTIEGILSSAKYVAKINPQRSGKDDFTRLQFVNENKFYAEILPEINDILRENHQESIRVPKFHHYSNEVGSEIIFLEDMRERGFKLYDRFEGVDDLHANLVFKELGRLHAAGKLMIERYGEQEAIAKFKLLDSAFESEDEDSNMNRWTVSMLLLGSKIIDNVGEKYQRAAQALREMLPRLDKIFEDIFAPRQPFATIQHGDCWNNNILFRYENGTPVEVCLLDLQMSKYASVGTDLNYFAYLSFQGPVRREFLDGFLDSYYDAYTGVAGHHFTRQELRAEYEAKKVYGLIATTILLPLIMSHGDYQPFGNLEQENGEEKMTEYERDTIKSMCKIQNFEPRFVDMVEEMIEAGILV